MLDPFFKIRRPGMNKSINHNTNVRVDCNGQHSTQNNENALKAKSVTGSKLTKTTSIPDNEKSTQHSKKNSNIGKKYRIKAKPSSSFKNGDNVTPVPQECNLSLVPIENPCKGSCTNLINNDLSPESRLNQHHSRTNGGKKYRIKAKSLCKNDEPVTQIKVVPNKVTSNNITQVKVTSKCTNVTSNNITQVKVISKCDIPRKEPCVKNKTTNPGCPYGVACAASLFGFCTVKRKHGIQGEITYETLKLCVGNAIKNKDNNKLLRLLSFYNKFTPKIHRQSIDVCRFGAFCEYCNLDILDPLVITKNKAQKYFNDHELAKCLMFHPKKDLSLIATIKAIDLNKLLTIINTIPNAFEKNIRYNLPHKEVCDNKCDCPANMRADADTKSRGYNAPIDSINFPPILYEYDKAENSTLILNIFPLKCSVPKDIQEDERCPFEKGVYGCSTYRLGKCAYQQHSLLKLPLIYELVQHLSYDEESSKLAAERGKYIMFCCKTRIDAQPELIRKEKERKLSIERSEQALISLEKTLDNNIPDLLQYFACDKEFSKRAAEIDNEREEIDKYVLIGNKRRKHSDQIKNAEEKKASLERAEQLSKELEEKWSNNKFRNVDLLIMCVGDDEFTTPPEMLGYRPASYKKSTTNRKLKNKKQKTTTPTTTTTPTPTTTPTTNTLSNEHGQLFVIKVDQLDEEWLNFNGSVDTIPNFVLEADESFGVKRRLSRMIPIHRLACPYNKTCSVVHCPNHDSDYNPGRFYCDIPGCYDKRCKKLHGKCKHLYLRICNEERKKTGKKYKTNPKPCRNVHFDDEENSTYKQKKNKQLQIFLILLDDLVWLSTEGWLNYGEYYKDLIKNLAIVASYYNISEDAIYEALDKTRINNIKNQILINNIWIFISKYINLKGVYRDKKNSITRIIREKKLTSIKTESQSKAKKNRIIELKRRAKLFVLMADGLDITKLITLSEICRPIGDDLDYVYSDDNRTSYSEDDYMNVPTSLKRFKIARYITKFLKAIVTAKIYSKLALLDCNPIRYLEEINKTYDVGEIVDILGIIINSVTMKENDSDLKCEWNLILKGLDQMAEFYPKIPRHEIILKLVKVLIKVKGDDEINKILNPLSKSIEMYSKYLQRIRSDDEHSSDKIPFFDGSDHKDTCDDNGRITTADDYQSNENYYGLLINY